MGWPLTWMGRTEAGRGPELSWCYLHPLCFGAWELKVALETHSSVEVRVRSLRRSGKGRPMPPLPFLSNTPRSLTLTVHAKPPTSRTDSARGRQAQLTGLAALQDMCQEQWTHTALNASGVTGSCQTGQIPLWRSKPRSKTPSMAAGAALPGPWTQLVSMAMVLWASDPWESCPSQHFHHLPHRPQAENS